LHFYSKDDKFSFIDSLKFEKKYIPGPNKYELNYSQVVGHVPDLYCNKNKKERIGKIERKNDPSPHTYKDEEAYAKTQLCSSRRNAFGKAKYKSFIGKPI